MPKIEKSGKDTIIFATKEDHSTPCTVTLPEPEPSPGLILPNGEINWNCPCLGGMATGPCGIEFREAFSCFQYSKADPKGSDCYEAFKTMQTCMSQYPELYASRESDIPDMDDENGDEHTRIEADKKEITASQSSSPADSNSDKAHEKPSSDK